MPRGGWQLTPEGERASICVIQISSTDRLPSIEVSANIKSDNSRIGNIIFYDIYQSEQFGAKYPGNYWKNYRPVTGIRVPTWDRYTMEITVKINRNQQTIRGNVIPYEDKAYQ